MKFIIFEEHRCISLYEDGVSIRELYQSRRNAFILLYIRGPTFQDVRARCLQEGVPVHVPVHVNIQDGCQETWNFLPDFALDNLAAKCQNIVGKVFFCMFNHSVNVAACTDRKIV